MQSSKSSNKDSKDSKSSKDDKKDAKDVGDGAHVDAVSIFICSKTSNTAFMLVLFCGRSKEYMAVSYPK